MTGRQERSQPGRNHLGMRLSGDRHLTQMKTGHADFKNHALDGGVGDGHPTHGRVLLAERNPIGTGTTNGPPQTGQNE